MRMLENALGLTSDSRAVKPGIIFFAVEGTSRDGHDFVKQALAQGALATVIRADHPRAKELCAFSPAVVSVKDTRQALGEAASRFYGDPSRKLRVCAVTGTNGKTTTTYLLEAVLSEHGWNTAVIGTVENRLGAYRVMATHTTPDPVNLQKLLNDFLERGAKAIAIEVSSHALDQKRVSGMSFETAIFTNLTQDHLDYHHTLEAYFVAKSTLFFDYPLKVRAIHLDDPYGDRLAHECRKRGLEVITFGSRAANVNYGDLKLLPNSIEGVVNIDYAGKRDSVEISCPLLGAFNAQNIAGVIAASIGLGIPCATIHTALSNAKQVPGRMETVANKRNLTVVVDYAHTPDALEKALKALRGVCRGKLLCVFGCGGDRDPGKRPIMGGIAERLADRIFVTSDNPRTEKPDLIIESILSGISDRARVKTIADRRAAIGAAISELEIRDILLIAGKGHEDYQIIGTTKTHFDDREVVREYLGS